MKTVMDIVERANDPVPWSEGDNIPWNDPEFSERMLAEHLSQDHDLASRKSEAIDTHVDWILSSSPDRGPKRVLDLGCGPGLYAQRLAGRGCKYVGLDFSPASIRYAQESAAAVGLDCRFILGDLRDQDFGSGYDLVMLIYGQFNVFPREVGIEILKKAHSALEPGGRLVMEFQGAEQIRSGAQAGPSWYSVATGLFSDRPHLVLQENFWDDDAAASTTRFMVVDAASGEVTRYALSNEAYTAEEIEEALRATGFNEVEHFPSLAGRAVAEETDLPVVVAVG